MEFNNFRRHNARFYGTRAQSSFNNDQSEMSKLTENLIQNKMSGTDALTGLNSLFGSAPIVSDKTFKTYEPREADLCSIAKRRESVPLVFPQRVSPFHIVYESPIEDLQQNLTYRDRVIFPINAMVRSFFNTVSSLFPKYKSQEDSVDPDTWAHNGVPKSKSDGDIVAETHNSSQRMSGTDIMCSVDKKHLLDSCQDYPGPNDNISFNKFTKSLSHDENCNGKVEDRQFLVDDQVTSGVAGSNIDCYETVPENNQHPKSDSLISSRDEVDFSSGFISPSFRWQQSTDDISDSVPKLDVETEPSSSDDFTMESSESLVKPKTSRFLQAVRQQRAAEEKAKSDEKSAEESVDYVSTCEDKLAKLKALLSKSKVNKSCDHSIKENSNVVSVDVVVDGFTIDETVDEKIADKNIVDEKIADKKTVDEKITDENIVDEKIANKKIVDEKIADENIVDEKIVDENVVDEKKADKKIVCEKIADEKMALEENITKEKLVDEEVSGEISVDIINSVNVEDKIEPSAVSALESALIQNTSIPKRLSPSKDRSPPAEKASKRHDTKHNDRKKRRNKERTNIKRDLNECLDMDRDDKSPIYFTPPEPKQTRNKKLRRQKKAAKKSKLQELGMKDNIKVKKSPFGRCVSFISNLQLSPNYICRGTNPALSSTESDDCLGFDEVKGRFKKQTSECESDDSFIIVFSDTKDQSKSDDDEAKPVQKIRTPRARVSSECDSEDSFVIHFETDESGADCYGNDEVYSDSDSSSDSDSDDPMTESSGYRDECDNVMNDSFNVEFSDGVMESEKCLEENVLRSCIKRRYSPRLTAKRQQRKVQFDSAAPKVHKIIAWAHAYRQARIGSWERCARDAERFRQRIRDTSVCLDWVLRREHRSRVFFQRFRPLLMRAAREEKEAKARELQRLKEEEQEKMTCEDTTQSNHQVVRDKTLLNHQVVQDKAQLNHQVVQDKTQSNKEVAQDKSQLNLCIGEDKRHLNQQIGLDKTQLNLQTKQDDTQLNHQIKQDKTQLNHQIKQDKTQLNHQIKQDKTQLNHEIKHDRTQLNHQVKQDQKLTQDQVNIDAQIESIVDKCGCIINNTTKEFLLQKNHCNSDDIKNVNGKQLDHCALKLRFLTKLDRPEIIKNSSFIQD